jgi:arsenate reductase (thioredoxin)
MMKNTSVRILFVCLHNSGRSQMAEAFVSCAGVKGVFAESAGLAAGTLNPLVVESLREIGIDISQNKTKTVAEMLERGTAFDYVITVCDGAAAERCPVFPGGGTRLHWDLPDPAMVMGTERERLERIGEIRDAIRTAVEDLLERVGLS